MDSAAASTLHHYAADPREPGSHYPANSRGGGNGAVHRSGSRLVLILSILCAILGMAVVGLAAGTGVVASRYVDTSIRLEHLSSSYSALESHPKTASSPSSTATSAAPTATSFSEMTNGCSDSNEKTTGTTYTSKFLIRPTFTMFCNSDTVAGSNPLLSVFAGNFDMCMEACASWNNNIVVNNITADNCRGVSFIPNWFNISEAAISKAPGNCYLKPGPLNRTSLERPGGTVEVHSALLESSKNEDQEDGSASRKKRNVPMPTACMKDPAWMTAKSDQSKRVNSPNLISSISCELTSRWELRLSVDDFSSQYTFLFQELISPTVDMTTIDELDEFVNWDKAGSSVPAPSGLQEPFPAGLPGMSTDMASDNIDLVLENVNEDDLSFSALQHFSDSMLNFPDAAPVMEMPATADFWDTPEAPCVSCTIGGYSCKSIREGRHKGYCTSCVALNIECSLAGILPQSLYPLPDTTTAFPDSWPSAETQPMTLPLGQDFPMGEGLQASGSSTALDMLDVANQSDDAAIVAPKPGPLPKIGARLSRESVRIMKNWLNTHTRHPYPSDEEKEMLQRQTGLNKVQITNWFANARRRGKVQAPRSTSPVVGNWAGGIDIPQRRGTPALEAMNPLERWKHSPPENEPASISAITRAVTASSSGRSSGLDSPFSLNYTDDGSSRSLCQSSASSLGTSQSSNGSLGSAYSHGSRNTWGSFGSASLNNRGRRRRRRRAANQQMSDGKTSLAGPVKTFQCTFCTETFRTKHDWQRHEKSLHLSLERWVCAPNGPRVLNPENGQISCVFCGEVNPDDAHVESHNHSACQERSLDERTFYRKDHLNQHLRLVHNVKFVDWSMKLWKVATPQIRSRCGFCGIVMDTWSFRVDHLAEHFKSGKSMADWKGDWGFEAPVLDMVENSIPPYLIHNERTTPFPFEASHSPPESPRNAYELIKLELDYFIANHMDQHGREPTDEELMVEGCRIIFASELLSLQGIATQASWLRDVIMKYVDLEKKAKFGPLRGAAENRLASLKINGKDNLFEQCPMEYQLQEFEEACRIVGRVEEMSTHPSGQVANWLLRLIATGTQWLEAFRRRAHLPRTEDVQDEVFRSTDPMSIDSTIHSYSRLERELGDFLKSQRSQGIEPTDDDLQRQARIIIYEFDDGWNQTAADNNTWLAEFRQRHPAEGSVSPTDGSVELSLPQSHRSSGSDWSSVPQTTRSTNMSPENDSTAISSMSPFFLNDANCYRRLAKELRRWVLATMSPNNPNRHVPTDAELQHQARWIIYDDDDPWNQTAADNAEWLQRFKRYSGILDPEGPGLPPTLSWALEQGGSGFAPPYTYPKGRVASFSDNVQVAMRQGAKVIPAEKTLANSFVRDMTHRYPQPGSIFCYRELEQGLMEMVERQFAATGTFPSDVDMQIRAKEIVNMDETAADDPELLAKFKTMMRDKVGPAPKQADGPSALPTNMDVNLSDEEVENMLQDMRFELDNESWYQVGHQEGIEDGGVALNGSTF
ncbi:Homeobox protein 4 [Paramyrothecium foliicola]|nr:Homeobox protein 4 [Paramyrothecium foliicola]